MTDLSADGLQPALRRVEFQTDEAKARLRARYRSEARFKFYGIAALAVTIAFLFALLASIVTENAMPQRCGPAITRRWRALRSQKPFQESRVGSKRRSSMVC